MYVKLQKLQSQQEWVSCRVSKISDHIVDGCSDGQESVIKDCAALYAGTGNVMMVMLMALRMI